MNEEMETCDECKEKSKQPETECAEVACKCDCHWTDEDRRNNNLAEYESSIDSSLKEKP